MKTVIAEEQRMREDRLGQANWRRWGPYLSDRQWGTVREDYSADGSAWDHLPHDHARSRTYRWGEDGVAGISDDGQPLCFSVALWNERDPILKERYFGLTGAEGNHGEDVKELYYYLDATPSHSYLKMLYKYPQRAFPYAQLVEENARRGKGDTEFELIRRQRQPQRSATRPNGDEGRRTSTSTATTAAASAPLNRPAGPV